MKLYESESPELIHSAGLCASIRTNFKKWAKEQKQEQKNLKKNASII